ncbi:hypothetical protein D9619_011099 [Psilocybe cf. subviscida]|uniref:Uncharacterized protein n=1 Tax=Psilocybe cf. subviscida TaxID=2480587 RepID=A0A8H5BIX5_9AGAR|nr:hypothetical protein D9619_011099 [Psilocybe cf. subviscida]
MALSFLTSRNASDSEADDPDAENLSAHPPSSHGTTFVGKMRAVTHDRSMRKGYHVSAAASSPTSFNIHCSVTLIPALPTLAPKANGGSGRDTSTLKHIPLTNVHTKIRQSTSNMTVIRERNGYLHSTVLSRHYAEVLEEGGKDVKSNTNSLINGARGRGGRESNDMVVVPTTKSLRVSSASSWDRILPSLRVQSSTRYRYPLQQQLQLRPGHSRHPSRLSFYDMESTEDRSEEESSGGGWKAG